jgi:uncharacterized membrane protein YgdD (TMEM256/DUF423 family)
MMGWTMNFAHGSALVFLAVIILSPLVAVYLKTRHEDMAGVLFIIGWIIVVVVSCRIFSSTRRYED